MVPFRYFTHTTSKTRYGKNSFSHTADGDELSGSVTDPTLLPLSSSRNTRHRTNEELIRIMSMSSGSSGLCLRSHLAAGWTSGFFQGTIKTPPTLVPLLPEVHDELTTRLASVLLAPLPSPPLTALKRRDTSACHLWMSLWPRISACPRLSDGR